MNKGNISKIPAGSVIKLPHLNGMEFIFTHHLLFTEFSGLIIICIYTSEYFHKTNNLGIGPHHTFSEICLNPFKQQSQSRTNMKIEADINN